VPLPHDTVAVGSEVTTPELLMALSEASITFPDISFAGAGAGAGATIFFRKSHPQGATDPQVEQGVVLSAGMATCVAAEPGVALVTPMITPTIKRIKGSKRRPHATKSAPC